MSHTSVANIDVTHIPRRRQRIEVNRDGELVVVALAMTPPSSFGTPAPDEGRWELYIAGVPHKLILEDATKAKAELVATHIAHVLNGEHRLEQGVLEK